MKPLILAVFLSVIQASSPQPGEAKHPGKHTEQVMQTNPNQQGGNTSAAIPVVPSSPKSTDAEGTQKATPDKEQLVRIAKRVAVTTEPDYATWVFSGLLVIVGFLQAWILLGTLGVVRQQAKAAEDSLTLSRDTVQRQLRAYVCMSGAHIDFKQPDRPDIQVYIKNCGQTPAYNVRSWIGLNVSKYPLTMQLQSPPEGFQMSKSTLPPGGHEIMPAVWSCSIPPSLLPVLGTPEATIYVFGRTVYVDIFGKEWHTDYRLVHGGPEPVRLEKNKDGIMTAKLKPDTEGNEAT